MSIQNISNIIYDIKEKLTDVEDCKSVYGVFNSIETSGDKRIFNTGMIHYAYPKNDDSRVIVSALGEGAIWVSNYKNNGSFLDNISSGDYISSSPIKGIGKIQSDDILHNYTVAKSTCFVSFIDDTSPFYYTNFKYRLEEHNNKTYVCVFIGCTYHSA